MPDEDYKETCILHSEKIHKLDVSVVKIESDVSYIRSQIDNGLTSTVMKIWDKMNEIDKDKAVMETRVDDNCDFLNKIKNGLISLVVLGVFGGVIATAFKIVHAYALAGPK